jgi:hypothetical protein
VTEADFHQASPGRNANLFMIIDKILSLQGFTLVEGCLQQFVEMTGWKDERRVLYFGDHIINDLR